MPETGAPFDPVAMLQVLVAEGVDFVLIGGLAAAVHGSPYATVDVDIVPNSARANMDRLSTALSALEARVYVSPEEAVRFAHDGRTLADARVWNLSTVHGGLDVSLEPSGTRGYADLVRDAQPVDLGGVTVPVASLADLIRSKEAAGRERDQVVLPALRRLLDLEAGEERSG